MEDERVKTGIHELDAMLGGGFLPETVNLIEGAAGTGKTILGLQYIYNGITRFDEPGLILAFEDFGDQYHADAQCFGWDLRALEDAGKLSFVATSPEATVAELQRAVGTVQEAIERVGARRALVDSITHFRRLAADPIELRRIAFHFVNGLKREGLTTVVTQESDHLLGSGSQVDDELAYLLDSYILLRYVEVDSVIRKALLVLKLRGSDHAKDIRQFDIDSGGIQVRSRFEGREAIMSGTPRRMAESFVKAFVQQH
jgi:circadian clock protein KaiC